MPGPNPVNSPNPGEGAFAIVPSDVTPLAVKPRAIYVGGAGNISLITLNGETVVFTAVPVGSILPVRAAQVLSTNTTATLLIGIY
jgi:hypothetical protein